MAASRETALLHRILTVACTDDQLTATTWADRAEATVADVRAVAASGLFVERPGVYVLVDRPAALAELRALEYASSI